MANLNDLANRFDKLADSVEEQASEIAVKVAITILAELAYTTPVDTSKALSSWVVTTGTPSSLAPPAHFPGLGGSTQRASAQETIELARKALQGKKPGVPIYITNNQPYIKRLNEGHSKQQAQAFVERAIIVGRKQTTKFKIKG